MSRQFSITSTRGIIYDCQARALRTWLVDPRVPQQRTYVPLPFTRARHDMPYHMCTKVYHPPPFQVFHLCISPASALPNSQLLSGSLTLSQNQYHLVSFMNGFPVQCLHLVALFTTNYFVYILLLCLRSTQYHRIHYVAMFPTHYSTTPSYIFLLIPLSSHILY